MELASQECLRPSYYHVAISLYSVVVLEKN